MNIQRARATTRQGDDEFTLNQSPERKQQPQIQCGRVAVVFFFSALYVSTNLMQSSVSISFSALAYSSSLIPLSSLDELKNESRQDESQSSSSPHHENVKNDNHTVVGVVDTTTTQSILQNKTDDKKIEMTQAHKISSTSSPLLFLSSNSSMLSFPHHPGRPTNQSTKYYVSAKKESCGQEQKTHLHTKDESLSLYFVLPNKSVSIGTRTASTECRNMENRYSGHFPPFLDIHLLLLLLLLLLVTLFSQKSYMMFS